MNCSKCKNWNRISEVGSPGLPKTPAKGNFGQCKLPSGPMIHIKGILETNEAFLCSLYVGK